MKFKLILKNITFITWVNQFSGLIGSILVLPVLISNYSPEYIALWLFMQSVISFGMLGDSGFGSTLTRSVASLKSGALSVSSENLAKGNILFSSPEIIQEKLSNILHTSKYIYGFLSIISFVLVLYTNNKLNIYTNFHIYLLLGLLPIFIYPFLYNILIKIHDELDKNIGSSFLKNAYNIYRN